MVTEPRTIEEITDALRARIRSETDQLTNFAPGSFNESYLQAHAAQIREAEIKALVAELAGTVEYAGKELTETDLEQLGVETVTPAEVNEYVQQEHLDLLARNFGQIRDGGTRATTRLEFTVSSDTVEIEEGTVVSNTLQSSPSQVDFIVDVDDDSEITTDPAPTATPEPGSDTVVVDAVADDVGTAYNVGVNTLTQIPVPQPGVQSVRNIEPASGGTDAQSNPSLRDDVQNALFETADGGTRRGIISEIESRTDDSVNSVSINAFPDRSPPFVNVVIDGGDADKLRELIQETKPVGLQYNLARPSSVGIGVSASVITNTSVSEDVVASAVSGELSSLGVGDDFYYSSIQRAILQSSDEILSIPSLNTTYDSISKDQYTYTGDTNYELSYGPLGRVVDETHVFFPDTDTYATRFDSIDPDSVSVSVTTPQGETQLDTTSYTVVDTDSDGNFDAITITSDIDTAARGTLSISYTHDSWGIESIVDDNETQYALGDDVDVVDADGDGVPDALSWVDGGARPDTNDLFYVTYAPRRSFQTDVIADSTTVFVPAESISVSSYTR